MTQLQKDVLKHILFLKALLLLTSIYKNDLKYKDPLIIGINKNIEFIKDNKNITEGTLKNLKRTLKTYPQPLLIKIKCKGNLD